MSTCAKVANERVQAEEEGKPEIPNCDISVEGSGAILRHKRKTDEKCPICIHPALRVQEYHE